MTTECHQCDECGAFSPIEDFAEADSDYLAELFGEAPEMAAHMCPQCNALVVLS